MPPCSVHHCDVCGNIDDHIQALVVLNLIALPCNCIALLVHKQAVASNYQRMGWSLQRAACPSRRALQSKSIYHLTWTLILDDMTITTGCVRRLLILTSPAYLNRGFVFLSSLTFLNLSFTSSSCLGRIIPSASCLPVQLSGAWSLVSWKCTKQKMQNQERSSAFSYVLASNM